jgi:hypothetical protein
MEKKQSLLWMELSFPGEPWMWMKLVRRQNARGAAVVEETAAGAAVVAAAEIVGEFRLIAAPKFHMYTWTIGARP